MPSKLLPHIIYRPSEALDDKAVASEALKDEVVDTQIKTKYRPEALALAYI